MISLEAAGRKVIERQMSWLHARMCAVRRADESLLGDGASVTFCLPRQLDDIVVTEVVGVRVVKSTCPCCQRKTPDGSPEERGICSLELADGRTLKCSWRALRMAMRGHAATGSFWESHWWYMGRCVETRVPFHVTMAPHLSSV